MTVSHAPRPRTWRRTLRALALRGRARAARSETGWGPHGVALRADTGPWDWDRRPRQGRLGDCWVIASMLAVHETAPERLRTLVLGADDETAHRADDVAPDVADRTAVEVRLPGMRSPIRVERALPVDASGRFVYAGCDGAGPGWAGVLEKAIAEHAAGGYGCLQRGVARYGLQLLLGSTGRTLLRLPSAAVMADWLGEGRAITASTHPLSARIRTAQGPLAPSHVYAVVGADERSGHVLLRNPVRPSRVLRVDARTFRRGFLSLDVTRPLR